MKIELRRVSHSPRLSHETEAFAADVYVNGAKRGTVENEGQGGPNNIHPHTLWAEIEAYAKTLPPDEAYGMTLPITADYLISKILSDHLIEKDLKKLLKRRTVFVAGGKMYEMKLPHRPDAHEGAIVLNDLSFDEAFKLYKNQGK